MVSPARLIRFAGCAAFVLLAAAAQLQEKLNTEYAARVRITVRDGASGNAMPARVYLFKGQTPFRLSPVDAFLPLKVDLFYRERLWFGAENPKTLEVTARDFSHTYLLTGQAEFELPASGDYRLEVYRGHFNRPQTVSFSAEAGQTKEVSVTLEPVAPGRQEQWLASDDHIHLMRSRRDDAVFLNWLAAEDLAVGNFLELQRQQHAAVQYAFGTGGEAKMAGYSIRSGHESRSVPYGHTLFLGVGEMIRPLSVGAELANTPDAYPFPHILFRRGRDAGGLTGYAHFWGSTGHSMLLANLAAGNLDFIELFQFGILHTDDWYELLNAGFAVTGLAGSDFPVPLNRATEWPRAIPPLGPERALVKAAPGASAYQSWAGGVKRGAVLLSNGPLLEFQVNGLEAGTKHNWGGAELKLRGSAEAWFHREVEKIELIVNGEVAAYAGRTGKDQDRLDFTHTLRESAWVAARVKGKSLPGEPEIWAHTNPIYFLREGKPVRKSAARQALQARWRQEAEYYRNSQLPLSREQRTELEETVRRTTQALAE